MERRGGSVRGAGHAAGPPPTVGLRGGVRGFDEAPRVVPTIPLHAGLGSRVLGIEGETSSLERVETGSKVVLGRRWKLRVFWGSEAGRAGTEAGMRTGLRVEGVGRTEAMGVGGGGGGRGGVDPGEFGLLGHGG